MASKYAALTITAPASAATLSSLLETAASPITAGYRKLVMQCDPANTASAKVLIGGSDVALSPQACGKVLQSGDVYITDADAGATDALYVLGSTTGLKLNIEIFA